jgi:predicted RNA-binding Zn-ribbon protein involved in translation (DUF1610 family)
VSALTFGRLEVQLDGSRVVFTGRLDDACSLTELAARVPAGDLVFDCGGIVYVNSFGMREWVRLVRALDGRGLTLEQVAEPLMAQMNLLPELAKRLRVTSFYAHYLCPACGAQATPLVDAVAHAVELAALQAPLLPCPECGAPMELADFPERYLSLFSPP